MRSNLPRCGVMPSLQQASIRGDRNSGGERDTQRQSRDTSRTTLDLALDLALGPGLDRIAAGAARLPVA